MRMRRKHEKEEARKKTLEGRRPLLGKGAHRAPLPNSGVGMRTDPNATDMEPTKKTTGKKSRTRERHEKITDLPVSFSDS